MSKSKHFAFVVVILVTILLIFGNWATPAQANTASVIAPTPTGTPIATQTIGVSQSLQNSGKS
jgi:hypothetical protein